MAAFLEPTCDSGTSEWREKRKTLITSTKVKDVCTRSDQDRLAEEIKFPRDISHLPFVRLGIEREELGAAFLLSTLPADAMLRNCGLIVSKEHPWLAATPDRILILGSTTYLFEIKNWFQTPRQKCLSDLPYLDENLKLKWSHAHYYQVQTAMLVSGIKFCYFVIHGSESKIELIHFDEALSRTIVEKTKQFFDLYFKPAIPESCPPVTARHDIPRQ